MINYSHITLEGVMAMKNASRVIFPSGRVPRSASEPSRTRVDDGGGVGMFCGIWLSVLGIFRFVEYMGERARSVAPQGEIGRASCRERVLRLV